MKFPSRTIRAALAERVSSRAAAVVCGAVVCTAASAHGPGVHQHGVSKLEVAVDGGRLELHLESPLANLLGFEHAPRTDKEKEQMRAMAQRFAHADTLFVPTAAAGCRLTKTELSSEALPAALLSTSGGATPARTSEPPASPGEEGHADLDATLIFDCANPAALKSLEVKLFSAFPGTRQVDAQLAAGHSQSGKRLTAGQPALAW